MRRKVRLQAIAHFIGFCGSAVLCKTQHTVEQDSDGGQVGSYSKNRGGNGKTAVWREMPLFLEKH